MSWKRKKLRTLAYWETDIEQVDQGIQQQLMTETLWELWRKPSKHQSVTSQTISTGQGWRHLNQPFKEDLESSNIETIPQDANHSSVVRIGRWDCNLQRSTEMSHKSYFWNESDGKDKVLRKKGSANDPKHIQAHLWSTVKKMLWLGLAWLAAFLLTMMMAAAGWIQKSTKTSWLRTNRKMPPN